MKLKVVCEMLIGRYYFHIGETELPIIHRFWLIKKVVIHNFTYILALLFKGGLITFLSHQHCSLHNLIINMNLIVKVYIVVVHGPRIKPYSLPSPHLFIDTKEIH